MKKFILISGFLILLTALSLRAYFAFVPPPEPTLHDKLTEIVPSAIAGWEIEDMDISNSPGSSARITNFLNFDDSVVRMFRKDDTFVRLYVAYWRPGTASYRWAGAHTPDTCWVQAGWTRLDREYGIPFQGNGVDFEPAEFGIYQIKDHSENVYFWHLVAGKAFSYKQKGGHNIFGSLLDIKHHGLNLREEQFFIRLSSNQNLEDLKKLDGFNQILDSLGKIGLARSENAPES